MKILAVQTLGVLGVADATYSFARSAEEAHDRVLITGEAGSGKTRLLALLVGCREMLAPTEEGLEQAAFIRRGNRTAKAIISFALNEHERATIGSASAVVRAEIIFGADTAEPADQGVVFLLSSYGHDDTTPKFEYFGERRRLDVGGGDTSLSEEHQVRFRSSTSPRKYAFVPALLASLVRHSEQAARFARGIAQLSRSCRYDVERHVLVSKGRALRSLDELSASEADAVMFAATAALVGLSRSIVLVDTPELHGLDPQLALNGIAELGVDNQLIVASSATELAADFPGAVVRLSSQSRRF